MTARKKENDTLKRVAHIDKRADPHGPFPTQFAVTSKSTVLEVIPAV
jgi:hypothetical protein